MEEDLQHGVKCRGWRQGEAASPISTVWANSPPGAPASPTQKVYSGRPFKQPWSAGYGRIILQEVCPNSQSPEFQSYPEGPRKTPDLHPAPHPHPPPPWPLTEKARPKSYLVFLTPISSCSGYIHRADYVTVGRHYNCLLLGREKSQKPEKCTKIWISSILWTPKRRLGFTNGLEYRSQSCLHFPFCKMGRILA